MAKTQRLIKQNTVKTQQQQWTPRKEHRHFLGGGKSIYSYICELFDIGKCSIMLSPLFWQFCLASSLLQTPILLLMVAVSLVLNTLFQSIRYQYYIQIFPA